MSEMKLALERFYLKDASFESPRSPNVFLEQWQPQMRVDINTKTNNFNDTHTEVALRVTLEASQKASEDDEEAQVAFICEVVYAGIFRVEGGDAGQRRQALGTACPNLLFPYIRESIDSLVVKGGFPAPQVAPVNFDALYAQAVAAEAQQRQGDEVQH